MFNLIGLMRFEDFFILRWIYLLLLFILFNRLLLWLLRDLRNSRNYFLFFIPRFILNGFLSFFLRLLFYFRFINVKFNVVLVRNSLRFFFYNLFLFYWFFLQFLLRIIYFLNFTFIFIKAFSLFINDSEFLFIKLNFFL